MKMLDKVRAWWQGVPEAQGEIPNPVFVSDDVIGDVVEAFQPPALSTPVEEIIVMRRGRRIIVTVKAHGQWRECAVIPKASYYGTRISVGDIEFSPRCHHPRED